MKLTQFFSSYITLRGYVKISNAAIGIYQGNYSSGAAIFLRTIDPEFQTILKVANDATVYFTAKSSSSVN